jgi:hypothetical protein
MVWLLCLELVGVVEAVPGKDGGVTELLFDAKELVQLCQALTTAWRASLDLGVTRTGEGRKKIVCTTEINQQSGANM